jgi:stringent starvation protein B
MTLKLKHLSHSYPFLGLSRSIEVPCERVLAVAQRIDSGGVDPDSDHQLRQLAQEQGVEEMAVHLINRVCCAPWRWQFPPQGRGL